MRSFSRLLLSNLFLSFLLLTACGQSDKQSAEKSTDNATVNSTIESSPSSVDKAHAKEMLANTAKIKTVTAQTIIKADPSHWVSHGRTYSEQRHSPLKAINKSNITELGLQWSYDLGTSRGLCMP